MLEAGFAASFNARNGRYDPLTFGYGWGVSVVNTREHQSSFQVFLASCYLFHQVSSSNCSMSKKEVSANMLCPHREALENLGLSWRACGSSRQTECVVLMGFFFSMSWLIQCLGVCDNQQNRQCQKRNTFIRAVAFTLWLALPVAASLQQDQITWVYQFHTCTHREKSKFEVD